MTQTLKKFKAGIATVPTDVAWYLSSLGESLGKQQLFFAQAPKLIASIRTSSKLRSFLMIDFLLR